MTDTLQWVVRGESFDDGSKFSDWEKIAESGVWHWQYDTHEMTFDIYEHDGQFWKLYRARFASDTPNGYAYDFGGQACRMALVNYKRRARSPHSNLPKEAGDIEWVRTYEVDDRIHRVVKTGPETAKYGRVGPARQSAA